MSLQVWLPLNGSLENKGINNCTIIPVTTAQWSNGKFGQALSGGKIKIDAKDVSNIFSNTAMTVSFWYNNNGGTESHSICGFAGNTEGDSGALRSWDFFVFSTVNDFHWSMNTLGASQAKGVINGNDWTHFCITFENKTLKIYVNAKLIYTNGAATSNFTFDKSYYISFGNKQMLNDFRIYDECLSASRVSDIYDSLICHFDFNIPYKDQNLASRGNQYNFSGFNGTENQCPIFASIPIDVTRMVEGEKLTISFDATFSDFTVANGKSLTCYFQSCLVKNGSQYWTTRLFETHGNFSKDVLAGGTFHYEWVQTIKSSVIEDLKSSTQCHLELRFDYAQSGKINITNTYVNYGDTIENNNYFGIDYIPESTGLIGGGGNTLIL